MPFKRLRLVVFFAAAIAVSGAGIGVAGRAIDSPVMIKLASTGANLWVDSNGGQCTRSGTPAVYRDATACGSIDAAWDACRPGDTIIIRAGVYAAQMVTGDKAAPGCTVKGESNTTDRRSCDWGRLSDSQQRHDRCRRRQAGRLEGTREQRHAEQRPPPRPVRRPSTSSGSATSAGSAASSVSQADSAAHGSAVRTPNRSRSASLITSRSAGSVSTLKMPT